MTINFDKPLSEATTEELKAAFAKAQWEARPKPKPKEDINWDSVIARCVSYIDTLAKHKYEEKDHTHYTWEEAMRAIFGNDVWDWINDQIP